MGTYLLYCAECCSRAHKSLFKIVTLVLQLRIRIRDWASCGQRRRAAARGWFHVHRRFHGTMAESPCSAAGLSNSPTLPAHGQIARRNVSQARCLPSFMPAFFTHSNGIMEPITLMSLYKEFPGTKRGLSGEKKIKCYYRVGSFRRKFIAKMGLIQSSSAKMILAPLFLFQSTA